MAESIAASTGQHLSATNICNYVTPTDYYVGRLVAASAELICYAVHGAVPLIRVIAQETGAKSLLRGPGGRGLGGAVLDLALHGDRLGAVTRDGALLVWQLTLDEASGKISHELLLHRAHPRSAAAVVEDGGEAVDEGGCYRRFVWHTVSPDVFATSASATGALELWSVARGASRVLVSDPEDEVIDLAFRADGTALATGHRGGSVRLWQVQGASALTEFVAAGGEPVFSVEWAASDRALVTGHQRNSVLKLWAADSWECAHSLTLTGAEFSNHLCASGSTLLVSNAQAKALYTLHVRTEGALHFDFFNALEIAMPILSCVASPHLFAHVLLLTR